MTDEEKYDPAYYVRISTGDDGSGWVNTEVRERDEDVRLFWLKVIAVAGCGVCVLAGLVWAAVINPHIAGLNQ